MCMGCVTRLDATVVQAAGVAFAVRSTFGALRARVGGTTELRRQEARARTEAFLRDLDLDPDLVLGPAAQRGSRSRERARGVAPRHRPAWFAPGAARGHA